MKQLYPDLWQTEKHQTGILNSYAYFLEHPQGNILFYNTGNDTDLDFMEEHGGIRMQLLTHRDEAGGSLERIRNRFGSLLLYPEREAGAIERHASADRYFEKGDHLLGDLLVLDTPGHTAGSVCFFYKSPHGKSYLFSGDTFFLWDSKWSTLVVEKAGGSADALIRSLLVLRSLKPDAVFSSGFVGELGVAEPTEQEWRAAIDQEVEKLRKL